MRRRDPDVLDVAIGALIGLIIGMHTCWIVTATRAEPKPARGSDSVVCETGRSCVVGSETWRTGEGKGKE